MNFQKYPLLECMQKIGVAISLALSASHLYADTGPSIDGPKNTMSSTTEEQKATFASPTSVGRFKIGADFLYWSVREDGNISAITQSVEINDAPSLDLSRLTEEQTYYVGWKDVPGFKVKAGFCPSSNDWEIDALYTWIHTGNVNKTVEFPPGSNAETVISPIFTFWRHFPFAPTDSIFSGSTDWNLKFNTLDLALGKTVPLSRSFELRVHGGFKGTWQKQSLVTQCLYQPLLGTKTLEVLTLESKYYGVGISTGLDMLWHFTSWLAAFGNICATAMYERFHTTYNEYGEQIGNGLFNLISRGQSRQAVITPVVEFQAGCNFNGSFSQGKYLYGMHVYWEMQWWGLQNQFGFGGNIDFQGLTLGAYFSF